MSQQAAAGDARCSLFSYCVSGKLTWTRVPLPRGEAEILMLP